MDGIQTDTTIPGQSETESNNDESVRHSPDLQNWSLSITCSLFTTTTLSFWASYKGYSQCIFYALPTE